MKKSLVALAAMAAVGAASAQSSVTLYGILDIGYSKTSAAGVKLGQNNGGTNFHTPSRFGLRGTEDLGGGMKANFNLESGGQDLSTGSTNVNFSRAAWVGLSGGFGDVKLGRISSVATQGQARFDFNGISTSSAQSAVDLSPVTWYGSSRRDAQIQYTSPNMGGLEFGLGYVTPGDNANKGTTQVRVNYGNGPLAVGLAAETARTAANRTAWALQGSYDLGVAKVMAGYAVAPTVALGKGVNLGVAAPFGATTLGVHVSRNTETDATAYELWANYSLSKRTSLYLDYGKNNKTDLAKYGFGVQHNF
jgi:predicted porin